MRICFIVGAFPKMKCGVGDYCSKLAEELSNNGNEVYVITSTKSNANIKGVKIFNIVENWNNSDTKKIITTLKKIKPEIVNIQYPSNEYKNAYYTFNILPLLIKLKIRCKLTETIHEYDLDPISRRKKFRYYFNFIIMSKVIVVEKLFEGLIKKDFPKTNIDYIPISSSIPRMTLSEEEKVNIRKELGLYANNSISYFGFINERKGVENLLKCISKIDDAQLLIIGDLNKDNEYHNKILNLVDTLNLKDKIRITGFIEDAKLVAKYLGATDLCVLPFKSGVQKRNSSFLAAYNQLIPIITTTSSEQEDENGVYYVRCEENEELINKVNDVLSNREKIVREELNWKNVADQYVFSLNSK